MAADAVEDAGTSTAEVIEDAGDEAAAATRKATGQETRDAGVSRPAGAGAARPRGRLDTPRVPSSGMTPVGRAT